MRIGLVTDFYYPWIGGPAGVIRNLGYGLAARGHVVHLLAPSSIGPEAREVDGPMKVTRARTRSVPFGHNLRASFSPRQAVSAWLDRAGPDVLHVHHPFPLSAAAVALGRKRGIPVLATNHTIPECSLWGLRGLIPIYRPTELVLGWWLRSLLGKCDRVATPTATAANLLHGLGYNKQVVAISNGIDTERFSPVEPSDSLRRRLGIDHRPVVLYTGRLDAEKQLDVWVRAAAALNYVVDAQFLMGGEGTDRQRIEKCATELGIRERINFFGYLPENELPDLYRLADVYFITSPVELQSISTLEAVSSGLPVVAVNAGALPELVHDGQNGYLVPVGDWVAAADALARVVQDTPRRATMRHRSRLIGLQHDLKASISRYEQLLVETAATQQGVQIRERACPDWG